MRKIGFLANVFNRNKTLEVSIDLGGFYDTSRRLHMKRLAINTCISIIARTISQSEFRVKNGNKFIKDELYYRLNIRPNKNQAASEFWTSVIEKLIYDNEVLVIQANDGDLLIADSFTCTEYAVFENIFKDVTVKGFTFDRTYKQSEVLYWRYSNEKLAPLIDGLYKDYGELFSRILSAQKRKNQVRSTVKMDAATAKNEAAMAQLQTYIEQIYSATQEKDVAVVPEQPGFEYKEHFSGGGNSVLSVDEVNKVTGGFFDQVALALNIPLAMVRGEMADVEKVTKNFLLYTINPFLKKFADEGNAKFFTKEEFLSGQKIDVRALSYQSIFDLATSIDKLRASGLFNGNELREELGRDAVDLPHMEEYFITKNYQEMTSLEGGENNNET